jgi:hypothetical protein
MAVGGMNPLVIRNGTLIDGSGGAPVANDALVIRGKRIRSVGPLPADVRLEAGRLADGIILKADPLADIRVLHGRQHLAGVIKDGKRINLVDAGTAEEALAFPVAVG